MHARHKATTGGGFTRHTHRHTLSICNNIFHVAAKSAVSRAGTAKEQAYESVKARRFSTR